MGKADGLSRCSMEEKSGMDEHFWYIGELQDLKNEDIGEEADAEDVELEGIDVTTCET